LFGFEKELVPFDIGEINAKKIKKIRKYISSLNDE